MYMPIKEYRCTNCLAVFEQLDKNQKLQLTCLNCDSSEIIENVETTFAPRKKFCPKKLSSDSDCDRIYVGTYS